MSHIFLPLCIILPLYHFAPPPPGNRLMIYAIYPCPVSFCPLDSFCPHIILPPIILPPGNLLMYTIFPCPISFCPYIILPPYHFAPPPIILPPGFTLPPYHFAPYHFAPWKWFYDLLYLPMSRMILPPALDFVFILIKSPLQQKLMTGAHPVTVAPLVFLSDSRTSEELRGIHTSFERILFIPYSP